MMVGLPDVVTRAKLDGDRFGHIRVVRCRTSGFPIDFGSRPYVVVMDICLQPTVFTNPKITQNLRGFLL